MIIIENDIKIMTYTFLGVLLLESELLLFNNANLSFTDNTFSVSLILSIIIV